MTIYIMLGVIILVAVVIKMNEFLGSNESKEKTKYSYTKSELIMTSAERDFYRVLDIAIGANYIIFAQVHLPNLIDHKVLGQDWSPAFRHINGKSVDFVLCDKNTFETKLAIELDDKTHSQDGRHERDLEVEQILSGAGVKLMRFENHGTFNSQEISDKIKSALI